MRGAIIASAVTCVSHTITLSVCLANTVTELEPLVWQVNPRPLSKLKPWKKTVESYILSQHLAAEELPIFGSPKGPHVCFTALFSAAQGLAYQI